MDNIQQQPGWTPSHQIATQYALEGLKSLVLANGGAVVAILTFAGNAGAKINTAAISNGLLAFAAGLAFSLFIFMFSYVSQSYFTSETEEGNRIGSRWQAAAVGGAILSIAAFVIGCAICWQGFRAPLINSTNQPPNLTCSDAVAFVRAQADAGSSSAEDPAHGSEAIKVRGGWVILPKCSHLP